MRVLYSNGALVLGKLCGWVYLVAWSSKQIPQIYLSWKTKRLAFRPIRLNAVFLILFLIDHHYEAKSESSDSVAGVPVGGLGLSFPLDTL